MCERGRRCRIGQVVRRHVNRLYRGDRAFGGSSNTLLQSTHVGCERRLIPDRRWDTAEKRGHFRARLREAEDVVDKEQHVLALVAEMFGDRQPGQAHAGTRAGRLVHLTVYQRAFRALGGAAMLLRIDIDLRLDHLVIEVVALARTLADAGEHGIAAVRLRDVVDELHDQHCLADAGAAEEADLAALRIRREQVDDLDAGLENLRFRRLLGITWCRRMNRPQGVAIHRTGFIDRLADHVDDAPERPLADRHGDRRARVGHFLPAHEAFGYIHRDAAHGGLAQVLRDFEDEAVAAIRRLERVENFRQMLFEFHVDHGADHLRDPPGGPVAHIHHTTSYAVSSVRFRTRDDFDQFLGDHLLARPIVEHRLLADHLAGIARRIVHGAHLRAVERRHVFEKRAEYLHRDVARQQRG